MILVGKKECVWAELERSPFQGRCCTLKVWLCDSTALRELVLFPSHLILQNWTLELLWMFLCMFLVWPVEKKGVQCVLFGVMNSRECSGASPHALGAEQENPDTPWTAPDSASALWGRFVSTVASLRYRAKALHAEISAFLTPHGRGADKAPFSWLQIYRVAPLKCRVSVRCTILFVIKKNQKTKPEVFSFFFLVRKWNTLKLELMWCEVFCQIGVIDGNKNSPFIGDLNSSVSASVTLWVESCLFFTLSNIL